MAIAHYEIRRADNDKTGSGFRVIRAATLIELETALDCATGELGVVDGDMYQWSGIAWVPLGGTGGVKASGAEVDTGTDDVKFLTPKAIEDSLYIKAAYADAKVADAINDSTTTIAPSQNAVFDALALKQATLVSATNIKTINGSSVLGSGDLVVSGASDYGAITAIANGMAMQ